MKTHNKNHKAEIGFFRENETSCSRFLRSFRLLVSKCETTNVGDATSGWLLHYRVTVANQRQKFLTHNIQYFFNKEIWWWWQWLRVQNFRFTSDV